MHELVFGTIPSRRLGASLGINHVHAKTCSFACVYCQVGATTALTDERCSFHTPEEIFKAVEEKLDQARQSGQRVDYLTFVPEGEPTLDINLGKMIDVLHPLGLPVAVISNASLIWRADVRSDLAKAEWVSLKFDAVEEEAWRQVNRPHGRLTLKAILEGALAFAAEYKGTLVSETMLVAGVNDGESNLRATADFLSRLQPACAYILVPTRPPVERWVEPPDEQILNRAYQIYAERLPNVQILTGIEPGEFAVLGETTEALLGILSVHPMREAAVQNYLTRTGKPMDFLEELIACGAIACVDYLGKRYYIAARKKQFGSAVSGTIQDDEQYTH